VNDRRTPSSTPLHPGRDARARLVATGPNLPSAICHLPFRLSAHQPAALAWSSRSSGPKVTVTLTSDVPRGRMLKVNGRDKSVVEYSLFADR
jgi:hypothetical protein